MKQFISIAVLVFCLPVLQIQAQGDMVLVASGIFIQGCTDEQKPDCDGDEFPVHAVKLDSFLIGKYEVSQSEWETVMGDNPSTNTACGSNCPVESIDWYSMLVYCNQQTLANADLGASQLVYYKDEALTIAWSISDYNGNGDTTGENVFINNEKSGYRLLTEAEWEYAARGGDLTAGFKYSGSDNIDEIAWYDLNSDDSIHESGSKNPNELGLYDMTGNVWERVFDFQGDYESPHICNPTGPIDGINKIYRGGSYTYSASSCRVADRYFNKPTRSSSNIGFRVARNN